MDGTNDVRFVRIGLLVLGLYELGLGLWMAVSPGSFFDLVGGFGERNDHYIRDMASWEAALGIAALVAVSRPGWRVAVLGLAAIHFGLHAINHLVDVSEADPEWVGPFDLGSLALGALVLGWLVTRAHKTAPGGVR